MPNRPIVNRRVCVGFPKHPRPVRRCRVGLRPPQTSCGQFDDSKGVISMSVVRISSVLLLFTVVFFISCGQTTEEIQLVVSGLN